MPTETIERGDEVGDWSLLVDRGEILAVRTVPYDGQLIYSTEDRPNRADKNSEYGLDARAVVRRYVEESDTERAFEALIDRVQITLAETGEVA